MNIYFFFNGNTAVFNDNGEQVPELQHSWFVLYLNLLESKGIDPTQCMFRMPDGTFAKPFKTENGWNWSV